jgi:hypothetical protein
MSAFGGIHHICANKWSDRVVRCTCRRAGPWTRLLSLHMWKRDGRGQGLRLGVRGMLRRHMKGGGRRTGYYYYTHQGGGVRGIAAQCSLVPPLSERSNLKHFISACPPWSQTGSAPGAGQRDMCTLWSSRRTRQCVTMPWHGSGRRFHCRVLENLEAETCCDRATSAASPPVHSADGQSRGPAPPAVTARATDLPSF